jgi:pilus assembly protein TadC
MTDRLAIIATFTWAAAAGLGAWALLNQAMRRAPASGAAQALEEERRAAIRQVSATFSRYEPLVADVESVIAAFVDPRQRESLEHAQRLDPSPIPWRPLEYIACKLIEGVLAGIVVGAIFLPIVGVLIAIGAAIVIAGAYAYNATQGVRQTASRRVGSVRRRLPFAVDLMALMLEAGASFQEALKTVVRENAAHPLGAELGNVARQIDMGRPRRLALEGFQDRLRDQDVTDMVAAINKGEELGTPLSSIMRTQADQMRLKRSQWGEKAAAEAQVRMTFPSMVVMLACMLLILGPFLLPPLLSMF